METIKTYNDMVNDRISDEKALELFVELYKKNLNLTDKERAFVNESVNADELPCDVDAIEKTMAEMQNEGFLGGLVGGIGGLVAGDKLGKAICKALGVTTGPLYQLLTSKIVMTAICTYLGIKM